MRYLPDDYRDWLTTGRSYQFSHWDENHRLVTVVARRSVIGALWLLYEQVGDVLDLRYWVMPDGGISQAKEQGLAGGAVLSVLAPLANVRDLEDVTDEIDPDVRRQINELLDELDRRGNG